ncbi:MAG TPA: hypothetical protein VEG44_00530 [Candidatus Acidoferrales bacterium]|nr:hypothetical protein [Candidatus Acidoferrales bacterium]
MAYYVLHVTEKNESGVPADLKRLVGAYRNSNIEIKTGSVAEQITINGRGSRSIDYGGFRAIPRCSLIFGTAVDKVIEEAPTNTLILRI